MGHTHTIIVAGFDIIENNGPTNNKPTLRLRGLDPSIFRETAVADIASPLGIAPVNEESYTARTLGQLAKELRDILEEGKRYTRKLEKYGTAKEYASKDIEKLDVPSSGLPAMFTCPGRSQFCKVACYAAKNRYGATSTITSRLRELLSTFRDEYWQRLPDELAKTLSGSKLKYFRLHDSGDFFLLSQLLNEIRNYAANLWNYMNVTLKNKIEKAKSPEERNRLVKEYNDLKEAIEYITGKPFEKISGAAELGDALANAFKRAVEVISGKKFEEFPDDYYVRKWGEVLSELEKRGINVYTYTRAWRDGQLWSAIEKHLLPHKNFAIMLSVDKTMPPEDLRRAEAIRNWAKSKGYNVDIAFTGVNPEKEGFGKEVSKPYVCPAALEEATKGKAEKYCGSKCRVCFRATQPVLFVEHN